MKFYLSIFNMHMVHTAVWNLNPSVLLYTINISPSLICIFHFKLLGWSEMHALNEETTASTLRRWFCYGFTSRTDPFVLNFLHFTIHLYMCMCVLHSHSGLCKKLWLPFKHHKKYSQFIHLFFHVEDFYFWKLSTIVLN